MMLTIAAAGIGAFVTCRLALPRRPRHAHG
jgi:hypothetical protein